MKIITKLLVAVLCVFVFSCSEKSEDLSGNESSLGTYFNDLERKNAFNGVVLVAVNGKTVFERAIGKSNFETGAELTLSSNFDIASVSKTFTAVAIMKLIEQGKLSLEDPITKFFPKLKYSDVTIRGLLGHTSGMFDIGESIGEVRKQFLEFYNKPGIPYTSYDYLAYLEKYNPPLPTKEGEKYEYSNTGYVLLGIVIEKVSGMGYDEFLKKIIFIPAGMRNTYVFSKMIGKPRPGFVAGHQLNANNEIVNVPDLTGTSAMFGFTFGDDDIASNVHDMLAYDQALFNGIIIEPETLEKMTTNQILNDGSLSSYGLGFNVSKTNNSETITHTGGTSGFWTYCKFSSTNSNNSMILITNVTADREMWSSISESILSILDSGDNQAK